MTGTPIYNHQIQTLVPKWRVWVPLPVRMFLKASSTFVESSAEVSMNERLFFSARRRELKYHFNLNGYFVHRGALKLGKADLMFNRIFP